MTHLWKSPPIVCCSHTGVSHAPSAVFCVWRPLPVSPTQYQYEFPGYRDVLRTPGNSYVVRSTLGIPRLDISATSTHHRPAEASAAQDVWHR